VEFSHPGRRTQNAHVDLADSGVKAMLSSPKRKQGHCRGLALKRTHDPSQTLADVVARGYLAGLLEDQNRLSITTQNDVRSVV
jgi:hypothetical protein